MLGMRRHCEENHGVVRSTAAMKSLEAEKGESCKTGSWGTFVHIDIFQGAYFLGEVFCLGLGFPFSPSSNILCCHLYFWQFHSNVVVSLDLTIVLSSERIHRAQGEVGVNKLELFASESFFFFFSTNANQLLSWKAVAISSHTLVLIPCSSPNNGKLNHIT